MQVISDRIAYLRGLIEGFGLDPQAKETKLFQTIVEVLSDMATAMQDMRDKHAELDEYVESIDDDLAELEEAILDDDEDDDDDDDDDPRLIGDADSDDPMDGLIEYECPHCQNVVYFDTETFDLEEENKCPICGKPVFDNYQPTEPEV